MKSQRHSKMATDLAKLIVYLDPQVKERFAELAKVEYRTMSKYAAYLIEKAVREAEESGLLPPESPATRSEEK